MLSVQTRGLNSFQLKLIALLFMTIDHIAAYGLPMPSELYEIFRIIGRIAAPLFLFLLVEGLRYTSSKPKYIFRLYVAGGLITIFNAIIQQTFTVDSGHLGNILPTFMYVGLCIFCLEKVIAFIKNKEKAGLFLPITILLVSFSLSYVYISISGEARNSIVGVLLRIFAPSIFRLEYSFLFVLLGIAWYFINNKIYNVILFAVLSLAALLINYDFVISLMVYLPFNFFELFLHTQWCMFLAIPFLLSYNGEKGTQCKYLFYIYYPLHQYAIAIFLL